VEKEEEQDPKDFSSRRRSGRRWGKAINGPRGASLLGQSCVAKSEVTPAARGTMRSLRWAAAGAGVGI